VLNPGVAVEPLFKGGGQERRRRAGTENVAGIVGFGVAAELAVSDLAKAGEIGALRDQLEEGALAVAPDAVIVAGNVKRLPNTSCIAVPGAKSETLVIGLDLEGIAVSAGSACSSGKVEASHVLGAMGIEPEFALGAIRVSLGIGTTSHDIERFLGAFGELIKRLKQSPKAA
jgi:cysteine desulfurase